MDNSGISLPLCFIFRTGKTNRAHNEMSRKGPVNIILSFHFGDTYTTAQVEQMQPALAPGWLVCNSPSRASASEDPEKPGEGPRRHSAAPPLHDTTPSKFENWTHQHVQSTTHSAEASTGRLTNAHAQVTDAIFHPILMLRQPTGDQKQSAENQESVPTCKNRLHP